jgi:hypothetical protein
VKFLGEVGAHSLTNEHIEKLCEIAEEAARKYVASRVPKRAILNLSISVELKESEVLNIEVEVDLALSPLFRKIDAKDLADEAVKAAFDAAEKCMRQVKCPSKT